jgi:RsiW-degrading membrane proteinase PrsW (M82 family)
MNIDEWRVVGMVFCGIVALLLMALIIASFWSHQDMSLIDCPGDAMDLTIPCVRRQ